MAVDHLPQFGTTGGATWESLTWMLRNTNFWFFVLPVLKSANDLMRAEWARKLSYVNVVTAIEMSSRYDPTNSLHRWEAFMMSCSQDSKSEGVSFVS